MRREAKITSKGQITIPFDIRKELNVKPGDRVAFETDDSGVRVKPVRGESPFEKYRGIGNPGIPSGRKAMIRWFREFRGR